MKIYTKKGDAGHTGLLSGETVPKDDARIKACGCVDELQSQLGMARSLLPGKPMGSMLYSIQQDLFVAGAELASTSRNLLQLKHRIGTQEVARVEHLIDELTASYGLPAGFVVAGKSLESSALHVARAVCRRCERVIITLNRQVGDYTLLVVYFNRLSDLLFVLAWSLEVWLIAEEVVRELFRGGLQNGVAS